MGKFKSTWLMAIGVAVLAAYTLYDFKQSEGEGITAKGQRRLFYLLRDDLEEIELTTKGVTTLVKKDGDGWKLVKPVDDLAESSAIEGFVFSLLTQKGKEFQSDDDRKNVKAAEYGLDPVENKITIRGKGKTELLEISSKNTFDGNFYVRSNSQSEILVGDRALAQLIEREPASFRSRRIYRETEDVKQIEVRVDGDFKDSYVFKRENDKWVMVPDPGFPIDTVKTNQWMQKVQGLTPSLVVAETVSEEDRSQYLLKKPSLLVKMDSWELTLGQDKAGEVFLFTNKRPTLYKAPATSAGVLRVPKAYFRDGREPFKVDVERIAEVDVNSGAVRAAFVKKESAWSLKGERKNEELNADKLVALIQSVASLEAQEFLGADKGKGFPATPQIELKDAGGKTVFALAWGDEYRPKAAYNKDYTFRYVKSSLAKEIVGLPKEKLDRLIDSALIKKKPQTEP